jgi:hypothetical protein
MVAGDGGGGAVGTGVNTGRTVDEQLQMQYDALVTKRRQVQETRVRRCPVPSLYPPHDRSLLLLRTQIFAAPVVVCAVHLRPRLHPAPVWPTRASPHPEG